MPNMSISATPAMLRLMSSAVSLAMMAAPALAVPSARAAAGDMAASSAVFGEPPPVAVLDPHPATPEQLWQLRSALNVAAMLCPDRAIAAGYNAMLRNHAPLLAQAWAAEQRRFRASHGGSWQLAQDRSLTSYYNRLANTGDRTLFCQRAGQIVAQARHVPPGMFAHFATQAVPRLAGLAAPARLAGRR